VLLKGLCVIMCSQNDDPTTYDYPPIGIYDYPPVARTEEELEERIPLTQEELRYVHGGDLHIHDWKCHA
jgi:hypothetical protein